MTPRSLTQFFETQAELRNLRLYFSEDKDTLVCKYTFTEDDCMGHWVGVDAIPLYMIKGHMNHVAELHHWTLNGGGDSCAIPAIVGFYAHRFAYRVPRPGQAVEITSTCLGPIDDERATYKVKIVGSNIISQIKFEVMLCTV